MLRRILPLVLLGVGSVALAQEGTYNYSQSIQSGDSRGTISYRLVLDRDNKATLTISLSGRIKNDRETLHDFGSVVNDALENRNRIVYTGDYVATRSSIRLNFKEMRGRGGMHRINSTLSGRQPDAKVIELTGYDKFEFGTRIRFRFVKGR